MLKLTDARPEFRGMHIYIAIQHIVSMCPLDDGNTAIQVTGGAIYIVEDALCDIVKAKGFPKLVMPT